MEKTNEMWIDVLKINYEKAILSVVSFNIYDHISLLIILHC